MGLLDWVSGSSLWVDKALAVTAILGVNQWTEDSSVSPSFSNTCLSNKNKYIFFCFRFVLKNRCGVVVKLPLKPASSSPGLCSANVPGKPADDGSSIWVPATHVRNLDGIPDSGLQPSPDLAVVDI